MERIFDFGVFSAVYILLFRFRYIENQKNISNCKGFLIWKVPLGNFQGSSGELPKFLWGTLLPN